MISRGCLHVPGIIVGVDTHKDEHVAVVVDKLGVRIGQRNLPTTNMGYVSLEPTNSVARDVLKRVLDFSKGFKPRGERTCKAPTRPSAYSDTHFIHRFKVSLRDRSDIWRIIDIKGNQMLSSLHKAIFKAFDRSEEHQYSFFVSNKPFDRESEYTSPGIGDDGTGKLATRIRIDSVELYGGPKVLYLFDYGDDWWHEVELISVTKKVTRASFPRVVKKQGKSPPQYPKGIED